MVKFFLHSRDAQRNAGLGCPGAIFQPLLNPSSGNVSEKRIPLAPPDI